MLYEDENPPQPPKKRGVAICVLICQILALVFFFCCSGSVRTGKFLLVLFFGATYLGFMVGGMICGDI